MWLRTLEGWTRIGWTSSRVSESMPWLCRSCLILSLSARIDTENTRMENSQCKYGETEYLCNRFKVKQFSKLINPDLATVKHCRSYLELQHQAWAQWRGVYWEDQFLQLLKNPIKSKTTLFHIYRNIHDHNMCFSIAPQPAEWMMHTALICQCSISQHSLKITVFFIYLANTFMQSNLKKSITNNNATIQPFLKLNHWNSHLSIIYGFWVWWILWFI